jgi:hypothetical protein
MARHCGGTRIDAQIEAALICHVTWPWQGIVVVGARRSGPGLANRDRGLAGQPSVGDPLTLNPDSCAGSPFFWLPNLWARRNVKIRLGHRRQKLLRHLTLSNTKLREK